MHAQTVQYIHTMRTLMAIAQILILGCIGVAFLSIVVRIVRNVGKISTMAMRKSPRPEEIHLVIDAVCYDATGRDLTLDEDDRLLAAPRSD